MKRGNTIGVRLLAEDQQSFEKIVREEGINQSLKIAKIVHDWIHFMHSKQERGDITLAGQIISNLINTIPKESLVKLAKKNAKFVVGEMQWREEGSWIKRDEKEVEDENKAKDKR